MLDSFPSMACVHYLGIENTSVGASKSVQEAYVGEGGPEGARTMTADSLLHLDALLEERRRVRNLLNSQVCDVRILGFFFAVFGDRVACRTET